MTSEPPAPLTETPPDVALVEDHARLRDAFREAVAQERSHGTGHGLFASELEQLRQERDRLRADLDAMLASPSWRVGRALTVLPRRMRDRKSS